MGPATHPWGPDPKEPTGNNPPHTVADSTNRNICLKSLYFAFLRLNDQDSYREHPPPSQKQCRLSTTKEEQQRRTFHKESTRLLKFQSGKLLNKKFTIEKKNTTNCKFPATNLIVINKTPYIQLNLL
ncbi:hypothetical protein XELAEV_18037811mg [Xenopus laevis]|uniref:Uncharacterized protein n=1 Tax=Xenopus laevis TaxID=8355 RepID=A0A974CDF5_XENLA|nr:hypothetical protein XELAEV_18037811mg [Xenopus laevis]